MVSEKFVFLDQFLLFLGDERLLKMWQKSTDSLQFLNNVFTLVFKLLVECNSRVILLKRKTMHLRRF